LLCRPHQFEGVGQQRALVRDHLEFDPVGVERLAGQLRGEHRLGGPAAAGSVGQRHDAEPVQQIEQTRSTLRIDPAYRDGGQFGARRDERILEHRQVARTPGTHDQPRGEAPVGDRQFLVSHPAPPSLPPGTLHR